MKKLILITAGVALFSAASFAQVDTTKRDKTQTQPTQQQPTQSDQMRRDENAFRGWTPVQSADVPSSLRTTLSGDNKYKGWENGTIYVNPEGNTYGYRTSGENGQTFYFDKNGKATQKPPHK
jgi:hypothetical protein